MAKLCYLCWFAPFHSLYLYTNRGVFGLELLSIMMSCVLTASPEFQLDNCMRICIERLVVVVGIVVMAYGWQAMWRCYQLCLWVRPYKNARYIQTRTKKITIITALTCAIMWSAHQEGKKGGDHFFLWPSLFAECVYRDRDFMEEVWRNEQKNTLTIRNYAAVFVILWERKRHLYKSDASVLDWNIKDTSAAIFIIIPSMAISQCILSFRTNADDIVGREQEAIFNKCYYTSRSLNKFI